MAPGQISALESRLQSLASSSKGNQAAALAEVIRFLQAIVGEKVQVDKEQVLLIVGRLYDQYIAPLDIPGVPDLLEPRLDSMIKGFFISVVDNILTNLEKVQ